MKERQYWIDGLKFFACMGVFVSHYHALFLSGSGRALTEISHFTVSLFEYLSFFLNGPLWICVFSILSGYLIGKKQLRSLKTTILSIIFRYLRFALIFFAAGLLIYFISHTISFPSEKYAEILKSEQLLYIPPQSYVTLKDVLRMAFLFDSSIDGPLWMIKSIFIGNELSYILQFIKHKLGQFIYYMSTIAIIIIAVIIAVINSGGYKPIYFYFIASILGDILGNLSSIDGSDNARRISIHKSNVFLIGLIITALACSFHNNLASIINQNQSYFIFPSKNIRFTLFYALLIVVFCILSPAMEHFCSRFFKGRLGKLSFPIYVIHAPIIYSFSLHIFGFLIDKFSYTFSFYLDLIITISIVLIAAILFSIFVEKTIEKVLSKLRTII